MPADLREEAFLALEMPEPLRQFYNITNGITHEWFRIPPISDPDRIKETWNSIQRINDPSTSKYLADETRSWQRFLVFAELSGPDYSVFDRERSTIWHSEGDDLNETDLDLLEFISTALREVDELISYNKPFAAARPPPLLKGASGHKYMTDDTKIKRGIEKLKKRKQLPLKILIVYFVILMISSNSQGHNVFLLIINYLFLFLFTGSFLLSVFSKCPRCDRYFQGLWGSLNPFKNKCVHCGLRVVKKR